MRCWGAPSSWDKHPTVYRHPLCDRKTLVHVRTPLVSRFSLRGFLAVTAHLAPYRIRLAWNSPSSFQILAPRTSRAVDGWAYRKGVKLEFMRPGRPVENGFIESFNGRLRDACLNTHLFWSIKDACEKIEAWRVDYNTRQPHSALANLPPAAFAASAMRIPAGN
jgi:transposase InsO family protein